MEVVAFVHPRESPDTRLSSIEDARRLLVQDPRAGRRMSWKHVKIGVRAAAGRFIRRSQTARPNRPALPLRQGVREIFLDPAVK